MRFGENGLEVQLPFLMVPPPPTPPPLPPQPMAEMHAMPPPPPHGYKGLKSASFPYTATWSWAGGYFSVLQYNVVAVNCPNNNPKFRMKTKPVTVGVDATVYVCDKLLLYADILGQCMQKDYVFMRRFWDSVCTRIMFL